MVSQVSGLSGASLNQLNALNRQLLNTVSRISTGSQINQASDNPSGYYSSRLLERDVRVSEAESRTLEREKNASNTRSTRIESAADLADEIVSLGQAAASSAISQVEKDVIQNQLRALANQLDETLQKNGLGSLNDLGVNSNDLVVNGSESDRLSSLSKMESVFTNLLTKNTTEGSTFKSLDRKLETLGPVINNLKSSLSTLKDADLANESIKLNQQTIVRNLAIKGVQIESELPKSTLDLFG